MPNPPKQCIFCGGQPVSKEHLFAEWLIPLFPRDASTSHTFGTFNWRDGNASGSPYQPTTQPRQGHVGSKKVRVVCQPCNSGWLSRLEERTKPILIPMICGDRCNLTPEYQQVLSAWAAKTSTVADCVLPRDNRISQDEKVWIMERQEPPQTWHVWIAAYNGESWRDLALYQHRGKLQSSPVRSPTINFHYIHSTTFGLGHMLFLVVGTTWDQIHTKFTGLEGHGLFQIYPTRARSILWPPTQILADPQANAVANILNMSGAFDQSLNPQADWTFTN